MADQKFARQGEQRAIKRKASIKIENKWIK